MGATRGTALLAGRFDEVIDAARTGAAWAWRELHDDLAGQVAGYLRQRGVPEPDDVTSEVFLELFRDIGRFEGDEGGFRSFVFTIAHRRGVDAMRRSGRRPAAAPLADVEDRAAADRPYEQATARIGADELRPHLAALTDRQRDVLLLRTVGELTVAETAEALGIRPGAVKMAQARAVATMRERLERAADARTPGIES